MNVCQAAEAAGVTEQTIRSWRRSGRLPNKDSWTPAQVAKAAGAAPRRGPKQRPKGAPAPLAGAAPGQAPGVSEETPGEPAEPESTVDPKDPWNLNLPAPPKAVPPAPSGAEPSGAEPPAPPAPPAPPEPKGEALFSGWFGR